MMKTKNVITGMLLLMSIVQAKAQDTTMILSLKQCFELGIEKNVNVRNAGLDQQKTHYQLKEAQSTLYPHVEGYSNFNYYFAIPKMVLPGEIFGQTGMVAVEIGTKYDWTNGFKASQVLYNQSYFTSLKLAQRMTTMGISTCNKRRKK